MRAVKLLKNYGINNAGEVCGFDEAEAQKLIADGVAIPWPPAPAESAAGEGQPSAADLDAQAADQQAADATAGEAKPKKGRGAR